MLFPELGGLVLELPSVSVDEGPVIQTREEVLSRLHSNLPGPHKSASLSLSTTHRTLILSLAGQICL